MSSFPANLLTPSTWRHMGLGLSTIFFGLGALALISPTTASASLGVVPSTPEGHDINRRSMIFLGIRDVAVAVSLAWFYAEGKTKEMGVLISSWVLVCGVDTWVAREGPDGIGALIAGAVVVGCVGAGLLRSE